MNSQKEQIPWLVAIGQSGLNQLLTDIVASEYSKEASDVESYLERFKLWAGNLGAHSFSGTCSLEYRLRDASSLRTHLVSLLEDLNNLVLRECELIKMKKIT